MTPDFTKIPNDFLEILMSKAVNNSESKILLYIARKTYGWQKESDKISLSQFQHKLVLSRPTLIDALHRLVKSGLLVKQKGQKRVPNSWAIDTLDFKDKLVNLGQLVKSDISQLVKLGLHTKETNTKERRKNKQDNPKEPKKPSGLSVNPKNPHSLEGSGVKKYKKLTRAELIQIATERSKELYGA